MFSQPILVRLQNVLRAFFSLLLLFSIIAATPLVSRTQGFSADSPLSSRVEKAPESVLATFREAGMSPREHIITPEEGAAVTAAFEEMPPLQQRVLKERLEGISFLDDMPNTALTSTVLSADSVRRYHITFRAAVLHQTISQWITEKENTCFSTDDSSIHVAIEAGSEPAIVYILLHEATHVVDGSLALSDRPSGFRRNFTSRVWVGHSTMAFNDTLLEKNHFRRGGRVYPVSLAASLYAALERTPLVSLYSTSSRNEDLAECLTVYHLTQVLKQPFKVIVTKAGKTVVAYEPVKESRVWQRMRLLAFFYSDHPVALLK
jgi:hypothetical protein